MQQSQREIVILKPTSVFYSFLTAQLPEGCLPEIELLHYNNTAYVINKGQTEDEVLNEIERHYPAMFRHEIKRWLGDKARNSIENSFLDFLCCFKFELHSHIACFESDIADGKSLLRIKPRSMLLNWIKETVSDSNELVEIVEQVDVKQVAENGTVIIKNFVNMSEIKPFLVQHYPVIFEAEMARMSEESSTWPHVDSYRKFCRYFTMDIHTQLIHLV